MFEPGAALEPRHRKLIETAIPVEAMNLAGRAEKAVPKKGLPATMHLWWSRKPTGLARAVLFASLIDDPVDAIDSEQALDEAHQARRRLVDLTSDLARWDCPPERIDEARRLIAKVDDVPDIIDPFCGGGSIPVEAARLGLSTLAADLNPVSAILTKSMVEIPITLHGLGPVHPEAPPLNSPSEELRGIAQDVEAYGRRLETRTRTQIGDVYPPVFSLDGSPTVAVSYLWARIATCVNPGCGAEIPMLSTWWLSKRARNEWHIAPRVEGRSIALDVRPGRPDRLPDEPKVGRGANYRCVRCSHVTDAHAIRKQGIAGQLGLRLAAIQTFADPARPRGGRAWTAATPEQERAALDAWPTNVPFPLESLRVPNVSGNVTSFGIETFEDLLTARQRLLLVTMCEALDGLRPEIVAAALDKGLAADETSLRDGGRGARAYAEGVATYLTIAISRMANRVSSMTIHNRANGSVEQSFVQPAYAFYGEFPEANPFSGSTGSWANSLEHVAAAVAQLPVGPATQVKCGSALEVLPHVRGIVSSDPPYYDMFDYAALSNLFYPWMRLALRSVWPDETRWLLAPDTDQIVSNASRFGGDSRAAHDHFEARLREGFRAMASAQASGFPLTLYYGYQQTVQRSDGRSSTAWEALLEALMDSGFCIVRTWPLRTERPEGVKSSSNALASSILLVCRQQDAGAGRATRREFIAKLKTQLPVAIVAMQETNIAPVDLAQAAIGPGMEVFSSYSAVLDADGGIMTVRTALELINHTLDEVLSGTDTRLDALTQWAVTWFEQFGLEEGPYGAAEQLSKARNTSMDELAGRGIVVQLPGRVRLATREELVDTRTTNPAGSTWVETQLIVHASDDGEQAAARRVARLDSEGAETVKELAYRLYAVSTQKKLASEGAVYNRLISMWPAILDLASHVSGTDTQPTLS